MTAVKFPNARPNVIHSIDNCMCYLQGDRPITVQPCREEIKINIGKYSIEGGEIVIRLPINPTSTKLDSKRDILSSTRGRDSFIYDGDIVYVNANVWKEQK